jgi:hypothetical protein
MPLGMGNATGRGRGAASTCCAATDGGGKRRFDFRGKSEGLVGGRGQGLNSAGRLTQMAQVAGEKKLFTQGSKGWVYG